MNERADLLQKKITLTFWLGMLPVILLFGLDVLLHQLQVEVAPPVGSLRLWGIVLLILSVGCGIALPILMRTLFQSRAAKKKSVSFEEYQRFILALTLVALSAALLADIAYLFVVPKLYLYGSVLAGLYGIYSAIPSRRKISAELKYYGLEGRDGD